jgi:adenylate cyclase
MPAMPEARRPSIAHCDTSAVAEWLIDGGRSASEADEVLAELCARLTSCGIPLWRVAVFVQTLHPQIMGRAFFWRPEHGVEVNDASYSMLESDDFRDSPVAEVHAAVRTLRWRLSDPDCPLHFRLLRRLREEGATDYLAAPLIFTDGAVHVASWTTRQPGGFTPDQLAGIEAIIRPLARVAEVRALRRTAANLLDTYVGNHAGARILAGHIRLGDTEAIDAAIWISDVRRSTRLAELLPPDRFIELLNRYFDCQIPTLSAHGGEVLKFMGDGLLAIFPIGERGDVGEVCRQALAAARVAAGNVVRLDDTLRSPAQDPERPLFGVALHVGRVLYGNIGSAGRLDFTCIGPAVNLAARLERLAAKLGRTILASEEFATCCSAGEELTRIGAFRLPGFAAEQTIYAPSA